MCAQWRDVLIWFRFLIQKVGRMKRMKCKFHKLCLLYQKDSCNKESGSGFCDPLHRGFSWRPIEKVMQKKKPTIISVNLKKKKTLQVEQMAKSFDTCFQRCSLTSLEKMKEHIEKMREAYGFYRGLIDEMLFIWLKERIKKLQLEQ